MSDDLVKRLRDDQPVTQDMVSTMQCALQDAAADRIEALEADVKAVLRREENANRAAMEHLRALEKERIKSANYAAFSTEWRKKCEALEARVSAADKLAEACESVFDGIDATGPQEFYLALSAYQATKENTNGNTKC